MNLVQVRCTDGESQLFLKWFYLPKGLDTKLLAGARVIATGTIKMYRGVPEIVHPELNFSLESATSGDSAHLGRIIPVYRELEGVPTRTLRKVLFEAVARFLPLFEDDLPKSLVEKHRFPGYQKAVKDIHFPETSGQTPLEVIQALIEFRSDAHRRLIYEEFLKFEYLILKQRLKMERAKGYTLSRNEIEPALAGLIKALPFKLTGDQKKTIEEIVKDFCGTHPMNRLVQGDVGAGKTIVAFLTAALIIAQGGQVALMAPTEILAEQHLKSCHRFLDGKVEAVLLTGSTTAKERRELLSRIERGDPLFVIGTHALIEDDVVFKSLKYVIIDEQHRFGVEQRRSLRLKGVSQSAGRDRLLPHNLVMTATPIPRTLALTVFGDLLVSTIKEMPPGRTPIITRLAQNASERSLAYTTILRELQNGRQAYYICPLVNESQAEGFENLKSVIQEAERLQKHVFPNHKVALLHGQMKSAEKDAVMDDFKSGRSHILVSTTVVEVGVDVPNATVIVVEHAERFGLSQLHQLRGRVGRGSLQSYCFLFSHPNTTETTRERLSLLEKTADGFKLAEEDLKIRGPGEFLGTRQSGDLPFKMADLVRDIDILQTARSDAEELLKTDPDLADSKNVSLRRYYEREGRLQSERLKTS